MNKALEFKNWDDGGNHYVLKGNPTNKWVGFQESVIDRLKERYGEDFYLVVWTDRRKEIDFYNIPFRKLKHLFIPEHKTTGKYKHRWTAIIIDGQFLMHANTNFAVDIKDDYGNFHSETGTKEYQTVDYDLANFELEEEYFEGKKIKRLSSYYERNSKLRVASIQAHGYKCSVCGFDFEKFYGKHGAGYIEVHHLKPVSSFESPTKVCPINDMTVVCSNCHRMLHRNRDSILNIQELRDIITSISECE